MRIGGVDVESPVWLAPLAGVSTRTFRDWHRSVGAGLVHTEMVSAIGLCYNNKKTAMLLGDADEPGPLVAQLFAHFADDFARGAEHALRGRSFAAIEVNMACPMPKVTKRGSGAALMDDADEAERIVAALKRFSLPVWVKTRIFADPSSTERFCARMIDAGADLLFVHGRTAPQRYEGEANKWAVIALAGIFPDMIAASGDVFGADDAMLYLRGGCPAVLAARGAIKDAYLISKTNAALGADVPKHLSEPTFDDQLGAMIAIGRAAASREGERFAPVLVRRMLPGVFKGFRGAAALRQECSSRTTWQEMEAFFVELSNGGSSLYKIPVSEGEV